jgi:ABC-2 type transport system permease protein
MFDRILAVAIKELRQLSRDRLSFGMIIGVPLMQMLLFGYAINFDVRGIPAAVVDEANTSHSRALVAELGAAGVVRFLDPSPGVDELRRRLNAGEISVGVYIPADFERRRLQNDRAAAQLLVDGSEPMIDSVARGLAMVIFTAAAIVRERERGNLELLITTPIRPGELMAGKLLPYVFIGLLQTTLVLVVGAWIFDVPVNGGLAHLYAAAGLFIAATLTLGLLISTVTRTQFQAFQLAFFTMLPSILLSGFMFPFDGMPKLAQWLAQLLPLTHFVEMIRGIVLRGAPITDLGTQAVKLGVFLTVALVIATLRFRKRLD